jgi:hypothetical protein
MEHDDPAQCREMAAQALADDKDAAATAWALLALGGEMAALRREMAKGRRAR